MNAKDAILYLYDKGLLNIDAIMKNKDSIMQELDNVSENKPKHDPCRLFKEGDRVQVVERNGRPLTCFPVGRIKEGDIVTVAENEAGDVFIKVLTEEGHEMMVPWFMLELVHPVEEILPYFVIKGDLINGWDVCKKKNENICCTVATFTQGHPNAKAAAESERDRLNAEYRKEQSHD